jgi:uncharacterized phage protein (TIGR02218 family)
MPRVIPSQLQDHLDTGQTTTTLLLKITPVSAGYPAYGITFGNRSIEYDDGDGVLNYSAYIGMQPSSIIQNASLGINNSESTSLIPEFDVPISEADIRAGVYDFARFSLYLVNYEDLAAGHVEIHAGTIGQVEIDASGLSFVNELRGLVATLKQSVCEKDSLTCRAIYGSQPEGSLLPGPIERFPCGKDATTELVAFTVSAVGLENSLTFTATPFALAADELNPGIVLWDTGMNAGRTYEIDTNTSGGIISLAYETSFPIQIGDTGWYRPDCNKQARDTEKGCKAPHHWGSEWPEHFRGEPDIPIGDDEQLSTPGASSAPGFGGFTNEPISQE